MNLNSTWPKASQTDGPPFKEGGSYGYIDANGSRVIPSNLRDAWSFSESLAVAKLDEQYGYLRPDGTVAIPAVYDGAFSFFREGWHECRQGAKFRLYQP